MTSRSIEDIGLWEVWVEYDQFAPHHFGMLYIIGEINLESPVSQPFTRLSGSESTKLLLQVPPQPEGGKGRIKEVLYSEPIESIDTYTSVCIYAGDELIASFDEIEVMI
jgi:hypothetical protein